MKSRAAIFYARLMLIFLPLTGCGPNADPITPPSQITDPDVLRKRAESGDAEADFQLAKMYHSGKGLPQDFTEAAKWYRKAAEQGNGDAQSILGSAYYSGQGVPQDYEEAIQWYRMAAEQGNGDAQYTLGILYHSGQGVPQDYTQAYAWLSVAEGSGNKLALQKCRAIASKEMTFSQVAEGAQLAREISKRIEKKKAAAKQKGQ